jgi:hypothetical protein
MDAPQSLGAIVSLFVLEEELSGLGWCFTESSSPPQREIIFVTPGRHAEYNTQMCFLFETVT